MTTVEQSIDVDVPVSTAYDQWTQFEDFPSFMEGVDEVRQLDDRRLHWKATIAGATREWDAEIVDQTPDQQIAWRSTSGTKNDGVVTFSSSGSDRTTVRLRLEIEPEGAVERAGAALNIIDRQVKGDLERFKELVEDLGGASGEWRGEVKPTGEVRPDPSGGGTVG